MDWGTEGWMDGVNWGADRQMDHWDCYSWRTEGRTDKQKVQYFFEIYAQKQYFSKWAEISPNLKCAPFEQNQGYKSLWLLLGSCSAWLTVSDSKRYFKLNPTIRYRLMRVLFSRLLPTDQHLFSMQEVRLQLWQAGITLFNFSGTSKFLFRVECVIWGLWSCLTMPSQ